MINKPTPFKDLNIRIPIIPPIKGRGFINQGSGLETLKRGGFCWRGGGVGVEGWRAGLEGWRVDVLMWWKAYRIEPPNITILK